MRSDSRWSTRWHRQYDVHPDGEQFLMIASPEATGFVEVVLD